MARRDDREYRKYLREEQRSEAGCSAGRMQPEFRRGLLALAKPRVRPGYNSSPVATLYPFRALRPNATDAARIAAVPYDVVTTDEARALAEGNPLSFLRVSRAELELPAGTEPYADAVYERAARNFQSLRDKALVIDDEPSVYLYQLQMGGHVQTGVAACFSIDDYDRDVIKKHERTRRDKEDDRTRHMLALGAQTGPVFLTYLASGAVNRIAARVIAGEPLFDFDATAARARDEIRDRHRSGALLGNDADYATFLAVAFPHDQVKVLPYNRVVK